MRKLTAICLMLGSITIALVTLSVIHTLQCLDWWLLQRGLFTLGDLTSGYLHLVYLEPLT